MKKGSSKAIIKELARREQLKQKKRSIKQLSLEDYCFEKQLKFITDPAKWKTGTCSRRAGKSVGCAADLMYKASTIPDITLLYITLSRKNAKRIIWRELLKLKKEFKLECIIDKQELSITFDHPEGESIIYITGAKDEQEIEKFRGLALYCVYIDECQSFREYIKELVYDVIEPALFDHDGSCTLIGTPGPICGGFFYDACHNNNWVHHRWTLHDNPHIQAKSGKTVDQILKEQRERRNIDENDPTYRRESLGEWVHDDNALVYKYNRDRNHYDVLPDESFNYIFGIDIGWSDADAIAVLAYSENSENVYLVEEYLASKQTITDLVDQINILRDKYDPIKMVMDAGALGKKIQEEMLQRHKLPIDAADKKRKLEFIELLNDDLRTAKLKIKYDSITAQDYNLIQWDADRSTNGRRIISTVFHSDISDAVLYAWREARHYAYQEPEFIPKEGTNEWMDRQEKIEAEKMAREQQQGQDLTPLYDLNDTSWFDR